MPPFFIKRHPRGWYPHCRTGFAIFNVQGRIKNVIGNNSSPAEMWPKQARLIVSISMQLETGANGENAEGPFGSRLSVVVD